MMELRLDNPKNIYSDRYVVFSKHRRGDVGVKLYYSLSSTGDVSFDEQRYRQELQLRNLQNNVTGKCSTCLLSSPLTTRFGRRRTSGVPRSWILAWTCC